jgi:predicted dehydrogenase
VSLGAGVVGAGAAGLLHALSYRAHGVSVDRVFDPVAERAAALAMWCGAHVCRDLGELAQGELDFVSVCSPPPFHVEQALACARDRRLVFVEKPVATSRHDLAQLEDAPACVPIVQWRCGRAIRAVRCAIAGGLLGRAPSVSLDLAWQRDAAYFRARSAWGCGPLLSVGIHALDALCFALDRPVLRAGWAPGPRAAGDLADEEREASAILLTTFAAGATAALRVTLDAGPDATRLSFCGDGVTAVIEADGADPTASSVVWRSDDVSKRRALAEVERATEGPLHGPLLVPFLGRAIEAHRRGARPGETDALPSIRDVIAAHDLALRAHEDCAG